MSNSDREYWRRRDDGLRRSREDARRVYWERTRTIRETENAAGRHRFAADRLGRKISQGEYSDKARQHLERMQRLQSDILNQISTCEAARRNWSERLDNVKLTGPPAADQLQDLLQEVESEKNLWSTLTGQGPSPLMGLTSPLIKPLSAVMLSSHLRELGSQKDNPLELRLQMEEEKRELRRQLNRSALGLIASSLSLLMTQVRAYRSGSF